MKRKLMLAALAFVALQAGFAWADPDMTKHFTGAAGPVEDGAVAKAASAQTLGARAYSSSANTVYGGFELRQASTVYILVRGNSLGSLGITQGYLDAPHARLFNQANQDLVTQGGFNGFNDCSASTDLLVINFYAARGAPVNSRDACLAVTLSAGVYTFTVTPSVLNVNNSLRSSGNNGPSAGEILFEVTLN